MFFWNTTVNTGNTYWQDAIPLLFYSIRTTCELEAGVIYVTISPLSPVNQEAKRGSQEQNRVPWESTLEGAPQVLHCLLPEPHEPAIWLLSSEQVKTRWRWAPQGHRGCWLTRAMSKGLLTTMESSSLGNWDPRRRSDFSTAGQLGSKETKWFFSQSYSPEIWTWGSETPSGFSSPCHFASFAQLPTYQWIISGFLLIYTENNMYFLETSQINFYYVLINLLNTQDLTAK